ncbi:MAG: tetratricopeptide repeat protein [Pseudomonadota bacterium]
MRKGIQLFICIYVLITLFSSKADTLPGQLAFEQGDYERAKVEVLAADDFDGSPELQTLYARIELSQNQLDAAQQRITQVLEQHPQNADALAAAGQLYGQQASRASMFRAGKFAKRSLAHFEQALESDPEHQHALQGIILFKLSAPALFGGSVDDAKRFAKQLESIDEVEGKLAFANIYRKLSDDVRQLETLQTLYENHPNDPRAPLALAFVEQADNNWSGAHDYFAAALNAARTDARHTYSAQMARYQLGRNVVLSKTTEESKVAAAVASLSDYLDGPQFGDLPAREWAHYRRGLLFEKLDGREDAAIADFEAAATTDDRDLKRALSGK